MNTNNNIQLDFSNARSKVKIKEKGHRKGIMKITIKLDQKQAEMYQTMIKAIKPDDYPVTDFEKGIFFTGLKTLEEQFNKRYEELMKKSPEEIEAALKEVTGPTETPVTE